jgi:hypothetical protein
MASPASTQRVALIVDQAEIMIHAALNVSVRSVVLAADPGSASDIGRVVLSLCYRCLYEMLSLQTMIVNPADITACGVQMWIRSTRSACARALLMFLSISAEGQTVAGPIALPTKFDSATTHLLINVSVDGTPLWCNLDTGFSALIAIDRAEAVRAGVKEGPGQPTPDGRPPNRGDGHATALVTVGEMRLPNQPLIVRELSKGVPDMDCIIGAGVLRRYVIEFDHTTPRVTLHDRSSYRPPASAVTIPLIFRSNPNVPFVRVDLELPDGVRHQLQTVVDTGTSYYALALVPPISTRVRDAVPVAQLPTPAESGVGPVQLLAARPKSVSVGPFTVAEPVIALVLPGLGAVDDGTLGAGFLTRFTVGFDLEGRQMHLAPNATMRRSQTFDASGIGFRRTDSGYEVEVIIPDTAAARAGLQVGDRLETVDGTPAASLTPNQLRDFLSRSDVHIELGLTRAGKPLQIALTLARRL